MTTPDHINRRHFAGLAATAICAGAAATLPASASAVSELHVPPSVQQWARAWNTGDPGLMASAFTQDGAYTDHAFQGSFRGHALIAEWVKLTIGHLRDQRLTITDAFGDGRRAAVTWTFRATFVSNQPFTAPGAAGKSFSVPVASYFRLRGRRIHSVDDFYNLADLMRQLGLDAGPYTPMRPH